MTIDPSKGGGSVLLAAFRSDTKCGGVVTGTAFLTQFFWLDQNGVRFADFDVGTGTQTSPGGTFLVTTDTAFVSPGSTGTSLDLGPNFPRSGCEGQCGSPINLTNGNTWLQADDYELPGLGGGISLKRTWNSEWPNNSPWIQAGMFGDSWQSSFEKRIQVLSGGTQLRYWRGDGSTWLFTNSKGWTLTSPPDERATLASSHSGFTITLRDGSQEQYSSSGLPTAFLDRNSNQTSLTYDTSNRLISVKDAASRLLQFTYDPVFVQQVTKIQDATGTIATYTTPDHT